jgi:hypothetical protein
MKDMKWRKCWIHGKDMTDWNILFISMAMTSTSAYGSRQQI